MAFNTTAAVPVSLDVLGGWCTEMAGVGLPEGVSPDLQDVGFLPGSVYSRPALQKVFSPPLEANATIVYGKSFVTPTGSIKNLYLSSTGKMYVEDWSNTPGTATLLFTTTPGSYCRSATAFGREYIAISDGLHGTDIPYQYDGASVERVTQDGPGQPPTVTSVVLPPVALAIATNSVALTSAATDPFSFSGGYYKVMNFVLAAPTSLIFVGQILIIAGTTSGAINGKPYYVVGTVTKNTSGQVTSFSSSSWLWPGPVPTSGTGGTASTSAATLTRANNVVFGTTTSSHGLQVGYQVQISSVPASVIGGSITSIVINNEDLPGIAVVTTSAVHGLLPGNDVTITGVAAVAVGGATSANSNGYLTTLTTTTAHGLVPGSGITVSGFTGNDTVFNGTFTIYQTPSPTTIVYYQSLFSTSATVGPPAVTIPQSIVSSTTGAVSLTWPVPDNTPTPTYFTVLSAPTPTTFQVQVSYSDGAWSSGTVKFGWDGIFYVTEVDSATTFQYQQYGPPSTTTAVGNATPYGQAAPGLHLCQVLFQTDQGAITAPSPPFVFIANGGQYISVTNIPLGPSNVVARIMAFTGAQPNVPDILPPFFYIPVPAQLDSLTVSTATVVNDNTTTQVLLDFSDNTLFAAIPISVTGNNLANQIVLEGALGFGYVDSRLRTWGQRNVIQNLLNMGFDGGYLRGVLGVPLGWTVDPTYSGTGILTTSGHFGTGWQIGVGTTVSGKFGHITQSAYADYSGAPIVDGGVTYKVRFWAKTNGLGFTSAPTVVMALTSVSASFTSTATVDVSAAGAATGQFYEATFNLPTPAQIPTDMLFEIYAGGNSATGFTVILDEVSLIDSALPYLDNQCFDSYTNNPEGFDGVSGNMQPTNDTRKIMDFGLIRGTSYCVTQDPAGRLHEIIANPTSEPSGWTWSEVAGQCGTLSAFGLTRSQADDATTAGGDDWMAWPSEGGVLIFDGGLPKKISQEIQQAWSGQQLPGTTWAQINMNAAKSISALNDPLEKILYFFLPTGTATAPNKIYALYYKELNSAQAIYSSPPFHPSLSGKLVSTDNVRKWAPWNLTINGAARMYRTTTGELTATFFAGNGTTPGNTGFGNVYTLNPAKFTDDDYGQIHPYYVTAFFIDPVKAQALQLTAIRLLLAYMNVYITGTGQVTYSFLCGSLTNVWSIATTRQLGQTANFDQELAGGNAQGNRVAIKIATSPITGTDNQFNLQRFQGWWKAAKLKLRGAAQ